MLTDFTETNSTRSNILLLAEKLVPGAVDNRLLMEVHFHIQYLSRQNSGQGLLPALSDIPYRNDRIMTAIETDKDCLQERLLRQGHLRRLRIILRPEALACLGQISNYSLAV